MQVLGVDGCPGGGWVVVSYDTESETLTPRTHGSFQQVLDSYPDAVAIGVDIPIGLSEGVPRVCDIEARKVLLHRRSSVFPAPDPRVIHEQTYEDALTRSRALTEKGISKQVFSIFPKVAEVNNIITREIQDRVFEVHPEVSFWALAGRPMDNRKKRLEGYGERRQLLEIELGIRVWSRDESRTVARPARPDDLLDATVAAWTARRVAENKHGRLPTERLEDAHGTRMEIVY